jgi:hypothetical protein
MLFIDNKRKKPATTNKLPISSITPEESTLFVAEFM